MDESILHLLQLNDKREIEQLSKKLSISQVLEISNLLLNAGVAKKDTAYPLIAGLSDEAFDSLVIRNHELLRQFASAEVVHHRFALISERMQSSFALLCQKIEELQRKINGLNEQSAQVTSIDSLQSEIDEISNTTLAQLELINQSLEYTWLTERPDLIQIFNELKSQYMHLLQRYIAELPKQLNDKLSKVFVVQDEVSPLEGIAELGFLYPEELQKLLADLGVATKGLSEKELLTTLENLLKQRGLANLKAFKDLSLFTKDQLIAYLKNRKN